MKHLFLMAFLFLFQIGMAQNNIEKKWELKGFYTPELVVVDTNSDWLYVSNIVSRTSSGYISIISKDGNHIIKIKALDDIVDLVISIKKEQYNSSPEALVDAFVIKNKNLRVLMDRFDLVITGV